MIRILFFLAVVFLFGLGFAWLADRPGDMVVTFSGYQYQVSLMVAAVTATAPAPSWRPSSCGDMWVLPCGASCTPRRRHQRAMVTMLCTSDWVRSVHTGDTAPSANRLGRRRHT